MLLPFDLLTHNRRPRFQAPTLIFHKTHKPGSKLLLGSTPTGRDISSICLPFISQHLCFETSTIFVPYTVWKKYPVQLELNLPAGRDIQFDFTFSTLALVPHRLEEISSSIYNVSPMENHDSSLEPHHLSPHAQEAP